MEWITRAVWITETYEGNCQVLLAVIGNELTREKHLEIDREDRYLL